MVVEYDINYHVKFTEITKSEIICPNHQLFDNISESISYH